ncbi:MAG: TIR domain-containing protein [Acidobacteria bacterium]|nr:TIR domain-containing protein [Acidobacteriota bacterium]
MKESDCVVVLCTAIAAKSRWVQQEIGCAKALNKHIVPLKTRGARLAAMLEGYEYYKFKRTDASSEFSHIASLLRQWALDRRLKVGPETDAPNIDKFFQILHLPHALVCLRCKNVDNHLAVCFLCGDWVCFHCGHTVPPESRASPSG